MIDAVLSLHMNPYSCGVAKFNHRLARELGVPCDTLSPAARARYRHPLVSIKPDEMAGTVPVLRDNGYDLFLHGEPLLGTYMGRPTRVYAANAVLAASLRHWRPDIITAWCPSTVDGDASRGDIHVLTFGMAHKLALPYYEKLKALLDDTPGTYTVGLSCAVHEGNPWDQAMHDAEDSLRRLFGLHLRVLGYLADDALVREMDAATAVAAFYDPAFRANNTSAWAVIERGRMFITNHDSESPACGAYDIAHMPRWPDEPECPKTSDAWTWTDLMELVQEQSCAK